MVELVPGSMVYVYQEHIDRVLKVGIEDGYEERSGEKMGRYLLGAFWSNQELIGATLSQKNRDRKLLDPVIIEAIICKLCIFAIAVTAFTSENTL